MRPPDLGPGDWGRRRELSYLRPIGWVVHGVLFERSGRRNTAYVWRVMMPLTVPVDVFDLSWSERIGGGTQTYAIGSPDADAALVTAAEQARKLHRQGLIVVDPPGGVDNVRMQEARAYGLLVSGDSASAREVVARVLRYHASYDWEHEIIERAQTMQRLLDTPDPSSALDLVEGWRKGTLETLGL